MSFLLRPTSVLNLGAAVALKTLKYHRPTLNACYATSAYGVQRTVNLDSYISRRKNASEKLKTSAEGLRLRIVANLDSMKEINARDIQELVFSANKSDVELVVAALKKLELQSARMRFSSFLMDAVTMRMFSYLELPEKAYETFLTDDLKTVFTTFSSVVILVDLLFRKELYENVINCIDVVERRQNFSVWSCRAIACFYVTACLKVNTPESLKKGMVYYEKLQNYRKPLPEVTLLIILVALRTNPDKVNSFLNKLHPKSQDPQTKANYSDMKKNFMLQYLVSSKQLSDIEMYLANEKVRLTKDTYDLIASLSKELSGSDTSNEIVKDCIIMDITLEDWIIQENNNEFEVDDRNPSITKSNKRRQEFLQ